MQKTRGIDETDNRYGKLLVVSRTKKQIKDRTILAWNCVCDCGNTKVVTGGNLRAGGTISCGCSQRTNYIIAHEYWRLPPGEAQFNKMWDTVQRQATKRNYSFELSKEFVREITKQNCFYCDSPPSNVSFHKGANGSYIYSGIDRVNNTLGYIESNVVACCKRCNRAKDVMSKDDFYVWINVLYKNFGSKEIS